MKQNNPHFNELANGVYKSLSNKKAASQIDNKIKQCFKDYLLKTNNNKEDINMQLKYKSYLNNNNSNSSSSNTVKKTQMHNHPSLNAINKLYNEMFHKNENNHKQDISNFISTTKMFASTYQTSTTTQSSFGSSSIKKPIQNNNNNKTKTSKIQNELNDIFNSNNSKSNSNHNNKSFSYKQQHKKNKKYMTINKLTSVKTVNLDNSINNSNNSMELRTNLTVFKNELISFLKRDMSYSGSLQKKNILKQNTRNTNHKGQCLKKKILNRPISMSSINVDTNDKNQSICSSDYYVYNKMEISSGKKSNYANFIKHLPKNCACVNNGSERKNEEGNISFKLNSFRLKLEI